MTMPKPGFRCDLTLGPIVSHNKKITKTDIPPCKATSRVAFIFMLRGMM